MKEILLIFFGWLLGLLSQPIVSRIEKYYKRKDLKIAIHSELKNLVIRLAGTCYLIQTHLGLKDKLTLEWIKNLYEKYREDCPKGLLESINNLLQVPDKQYDNLTKLFKANKNVSLSLKIFSLSFTESVLEYLYVFNSKFQRDILEIRAQISTLNEEIENAMFFFRLTFDPSCMNTNKDIIQNNLNNAYTNIQEGCKIIVDKIDKILES